VTAYTRVASKEHTCSECNTTINKGERYDVEIIPPWEQYESDLDDEGRTIAVGPVREVGWSYYKIHPCCYMGYGCKHIEER
jgi:hypothetical protein